MISEKKEFIAVDCMKLICALLIVGLHINVFENVNEQTMFFFNEIISRIGVPFFFLSSGFFIAEKLEHKEKLLVYVKRLLLLYLVYTLLYLPQMLLTWKREGREVMECISTFFRQFFFVGSYCQLWYFTGLAISVLLLYLLVKVLRLNIVTNFCIGILLFCIGVLGNTYRVWFITLPGMDKLLPAYYKIFDTTRNGVFFGLLFVMTGYYLKRYSEKIKVKKEGLLYLLLTVVFFGVLIAEAYQAKRFVANGFDMTFALFPLGVCLFLSCCVVEIPEKYRHAGVIIRNIATLVFGFHMFVDFYIVELLTVRLEITINSVVQYILTVMGSFVLAGLILWLSRYKYFKWLKILY